MYFGEIALYLDAFYPNWNNENVSNDKASTLVAITRSGDNSIAEQLHNWSYNRVNLLPMFLPGQPAEIMELCREGAKIVLNFLGRDIASARVHCQITSLKTTFNFRLTHKSGKVTKERSGLRSHPFVVEWLRTADVLAILETERGDVEKRSLWAGFELTAN
jgi:hypothetical protein